MIRTMLFIPGNNPNMISNATVLGADAIIFDLEDAVSPDQKDAARDLLYNALKTFDMGNITTIIRINSLDTPYWKIDLRTLLPIRPLMIMPPKVGNADCITTLEKEISAIENENGIEAGSTKILALLETAEGIENAYSIAKSSPRMFGLFLGAEDLSADLHCQRTKKGDEIRYARGRIVSCARACGIEVFDTPFTDVRDLEGLETDAAYAKSLGFSGKACISPMHINTVNKIFSPTEKEIAYAQEVVAAIAEAKRLGKGAISLHGKMIDAPIVLRAKQTLEAASSIYGGDYGNE